MSVFGGDSWARDAQHRKRRVDDLMLLQEHTGTRDSSSSSSYKKLSNGKYACQVCPNNPVLDSPLIISMHSKGSRHIGAVSRLKEKDLLKQEEIKKRIALSAESTDARGVCLSSQHFESSSKPLIERTRKAAFEILSDQTAVQSGTNDCCDVKLKRNSYFFNQKPQPVSKERIVPSPNVKPEPCKSDKKNTSWASGVACKMVTEQRMELQKRQEKELKFIAAGWKRDCHGTWFQDENVEFDSDEEDPNINLY